MSKYVMPPFILKEFKRILTVNSHLPPLPIIGPPSFSLEKEWELPIWDIKDPNPFNLHLPKSAIEEPEPHEDDERIQ